MRRSFVGLRGTFLDSRTIPSPKTAVRSSRSNTCRRCGTFSGPSFRTMVSSEKLWADNEATPFGKGSDWILELGSSLDLGAWCLDLFIQYAVIVSCKFRTTRHTCVHAASSLFSGVFGTEARPT